jgi:hypothetical protein
MHARAHHHPCLVENVDWRIASEYIVGVDEAVRATLRKTYGHLMGGRVVSHGNAGAGLSFWDLEAWGP